jgi:ABC-2 type transport system permease protein
VTARRIRAIAGKDLRDAWRDGRVATLLVFPVLVGWSSANLNGEVSAVPAGADAAAAIGPLFAGLFAVVMVVVFVGLMVVPLQTAEELETGTFGALRLAASGPEILMAKALVGYVYAAVAVAITVALTDLPMDDLPQFAAAAAALIVTLVGFGLLLGLLVRNAGALNAYGGVLVVPVLGVAAAVFAVDSGIMRTVLVLLPFSQAVRLLADGISPRPVFDTGVLPWLVILAWTLGGHAVLARVATRREL